LRDSSDYYKENPSAWIFGNIMTLPQTFLTTLMNWKAVQKFKYMDKNWGQKDVTFPMIQTQIYFQIFLSRR
jgi:hypothetical protein